MRWNEMTAPKIIESVKICSGVCILPMGCIERHGSHLPLGTDYMIASNLANLAADIEPAMVFPDWYFGSLSECPFAPGSIVFPLDLCIEALDHVCSEIARNGFKKILLLNTHGGNMAMISLFMQRFCEKDHDYIVYSHITPDLGVNTQDAMKKLAEETDSNNGHSGGSETALSQYFFPDCVDLDAHLPRELSISEERSKALTQAGLKVPAWWFAAHPHHYAGYGKDTTAEHGKVLCDAMVKDIVGYIRTIKADDSSLKVFQELRCKSRHPEL